MNLKPGYLPLFISLFLATSTQANPWPSLVNSTISIQANVVFWTRHPCADLELCENPISDSLTYNLNGTLAEPTTPNTLTRLEQNFVSEKRKARVTVSWIYRDTPSDSKYLATQWKLTTLDDKLIAECSRYDLVPTSGRFSPVGACSGLENNPDGSLQVGISAMKAEK